MRALLIVNPTATATTRRVREVLVRALGSELKLDVEETRRRGHAAELAALARRDRLDIVVTLGGDGTVNEAVNGLLDGGPGPETPALAVVPGGSANVFARSLGLPRDAVEATAEILGALREGRRRSLGLGWAQGRWFTFCAGLGLDAEVVRAVEARRDGGGRATSALYVRSAVRHFYAGSDRRHPALCLERPDAVPVEGLFLGIVSNSSPWTFLGSRPVRPSPAASFDTGLDLLALHRLRTFGMLRVIRAMVATTGDGPHGRSVLRLHDVPEVTFRAHRPIAVQVDGDYLGELEAVRLRAVPRALTVVA